MLGTESSKRSLATDSRLCASHDRPRRQCPLVTAMFSESCGSENRPLATGAWGLENRSIARACVSGASGSREHYLMKTCTPRSLRVAAVSLSAAVSLRPPEHSTTITRFPNSFW
jgi:hypothetical protein